MKPKIRSLIVAVGQDTNVIGDGKKMPSWHLRDDLNFFKEITEGNAVIMGRKNYESLPPKFCPLPNRTNIVLTRDPHWLPEEKSNGVIIATSLWVAIEKAEQAPGEKIIIIGGGEIYRLALSSIVFDEVHITRVLDWFEGAVTFPKISFPADAYDVTYRQRFLKQEGKNSHECIITSYKRNTTF